MDSWRYSEPFYSLIHIQIIDYVPNKNYWIFLYFFHLSSIFFPFSFIFFLIILLFFSFSCYLIGEQEQFEQQKGNYCNSSLFFLSYTFIIFYLLNTYIYSYFDFLLIFSRCSIRRSRFSSTSTINGKINLNSMHLIILTLIPS